MRQNYHCWCDSEINLYDWWQVAELVGKVEGVKKVLLAENDVFKGLLPGKLHLVRISILCYV